MDKEMKEFTKKYKSHFFMKEFERFESGFNDVLSSHLKRQREIYIKQFKEWEQVAVQTNSEAGCSQAMAFAYKVCREFVAEHSVVESAPEPSEANAEPEVK